MLVLTRKENESIIIDEQIKVTIISIGSDKVRIGITAPKEVSVHREEVQIEIDARIEAAEEPRVVQ